MEIFFYVLMLTEAGAGKERHDSWQSLQEVTWKEGRVSLTEPSCHTRCAPTADRKGWWGVVL